MTERNLEAVRAEVLRFGPSPFIPNKERPLPSLFHNEMETTVGTVETDVFGKPAIVYLIITTFRIILYKYNKRGDDEVRSYWFNLDCSDDPFNDKAGFLIAGVKTSLPEYGVDKSINKGFFTWETSYINLDGKSKTAEAVKILPLKYHLHQESRYVGVYETISVPGLVIEDKESYLALMPFIGKFFIVRRGPMGRLKMIDLEIMHKSPEFASFHSAGDVPEDCEMHENKATRARETINVKSKIKKGTSKKTKPKHEKETKKPAFKWKKVASTALDVGTKLKGGLDVIGKAASAATASGAESIMEISEKGAKTMKKAGESFRETAKEAFGEKGTSVGSAVHICAACGAPMRSGSLFCGKCGQKISDRIVEEVKDHVKGKVEDAVVDKAKEILDKEEKPATTTKEDIRLKTISKSGLPANLIKPLKKAGFKTLGDMADQVAADPDILGKIKGIGPASIEKIKKVVADVPVKDADQPAHKQAKCRKCGKPIQMDWSFCPHCQEPVIQSCPHCGEEIQKEWNFCPMCKAKL